MSLKLLKIKGPCGRIEAKYYTHNNELNNPAVLILHPHPLFGGTMDNKVVFALYKAFVANGFNVLRINFRGVEGSDGKFDNGFGELKDAIEAFDWLQNKNSTSKSFWVAGFSFGSFIAMQLLMRRPEISSFISVGLPINKYDFSFLNPCPVRGQIIHGENDHIVNYEEVMNLVFNYNKMRLHETDVQFIKNADHFFTNHIRELFLHSYKYINNTLKKNKKLKDDVKNEEVSSV